MNDELCQHGATAPRFCAICRHQAIEAMVQGITIAKESQLNWHNTAVICIRQMARTGKPFTAEDVVNEIDLLTIALTDTFGGAGVDAIDSPWPMQVWRAPVSCDNGLDS